MIPILRASDAGELKRRVMNRSQLQNEEVSRIVKEIVARVRQEGDAALFDYTAKFDHVTMTAETVLVTKDEIARAYAAASPEWLDAMREAATRQKVKFIFAYFLVELVTIIALPNTVRLQRCRVETVFATQWAAVKCN